MSDYLAGLAPYVADYDYPWGIIVSLAVVGGLLCLLLLRRCSVALMASFGRSVAFGVLVGYVALVLCYTVFLRPVSEVASGVQLVPFWKYPLAADRADLKAEIVLNILMFVPIGLLLGIVVRFSKLRLWKSVLLSFGVMLLVVSCLSVSIELLQYVLHRGLCETSDVIHNVGGAVLGWGLLLGVISSLRLLKSLNK